MFLRQLFSGLFQQLAQSDYFFLCFFYRNVLSSIFLSDYNRLPVDGLGGKQFLLIVFRKWTQMLRMLALGI